MTAARASLLTMLLTVLIGLPMKTHAGAPKVGDVFVNYAGPRPEPGFGTMFGANWYVHRSGEPT